MSNAAAALYDVGQPLPPIPIEAAMQGIASAAHGRGVVIVRGDVVLREIPARDLMRLLRAALSNAPEQHQLRVETLVRGLYHRCATPGPLLVPQAPFNVLKGIAGKGEA